jgi:hypothetical protein
LNKYKRTERLRGEKESKLNERKETLRERRKTGSRRDLDRVWLLAIMNNSSLSGSSFSTIFSRQIEIVWLSLSSFHGT